MDFTAINEFLSKPFFGKVSLMAVLSAVVLFIVCLIVIKIILKLVTGIMDKTQMEASLKNFIRNAAKTGMLILLVIIVADKLGIPTASLVALLGVAGLALSLSVQGIMSNLFSGVTILATKPFVSGDYVELGGVAGTVSVVGLFHTTMATVDNKTIYIPNSEVTGTKVTNYTRQKNRRVDLSFCVSYDNETEEVKSALMSVINADGRILPDPAPFVGLLSYKDSSIEYVLRAWVKGEDYWDVHFALNEGVRQAFKAGGIEMTYEHVNVHIIKD
ncbi:MAG: mechanosensitive ion channel [Oscillospiraceae bacterium]